MPLAIVKDLDRVDATEIKRIVRSSLGADYALEDVRSLADIGFEAWPHNQTGKVTKHELKSAYLARYVPEGVMQSQ